MIITMDGPAGSGKSSLAKRLATHLGFEFLDTGAMYRACAFALNEKQIELDDLDSIEQILNQIELSFINGEIHINGMNRSNEIRTREITRLSSPVSAIPIVREKMVELQRKITEGQNFVAEGRDMGTVVFPDSKCKIYITASPEERARRRVNQLTQKGEAADFNEILRDINERDARDQSREHSPLKPATDAVILDTSDLDFDAAFRAVLEIAQKKMEI